MNPVGKVVLEVGYPRVRCRMAGVGSVQDHRPGTGNRGLSVLTSIIPSYVTVYWLRGAAPNDYRRCGLCDTGVEGPGGLAWIIGYFLYKTVK